MDEVFLSFNGGKDCTVILDLLVKSLEESNQSVDDLQCWYIEPESDALDEVEEFVGACETYYNIRIRRAKGKIQSALQTICDTSPRTKACIMGSRKTDPFCGHLATFHKTDPGWVDLMRVNPILVNIAYDLQCFPVLNSQLFQDWTCDNIWDYILSNKVPYCRLYDVGYTSLGHRNNTLKNPHLQFFNPDTRMTEYRPAYFLRNSDHLERAGRV